MIILSGILAFVVAFNLYLASLPPINNFSEIKPNPVTRIYSSDGEIIRTFTAYKFEKVSIEDIPQAMKDAIISTEDKNFYKHRGFDTLGLVRSTITNLASGKLKQGASTITQQLARILFLSNEKTFDRKIKELIIAHRIEKTISKDEILEMYLNTVYLGSGAYGVLAASQIYFGKPLKDLTLSETALIAGLPQAPSIYSPFNNLDAAIKRRNQVLLRMYKTGSITKEEYLKAKEAKVRLNENPDIYSYNKAPYFVDYIMAELEDLGLDEKEISMGGYKIYTTLNYKAQEAAQKALVKNLKSWGLTKKDSQAALFSYNPASGKIIAYVGGKDYSQSQYDRVTHAVRPPGSSFKPFVYAAAIQQGAKPDDLIEDTPITINDWSPHNYGSKYRGKKIPLYTALAISSNVAAVRLIENIGVRSVISLARDLGITTALANDYTIALGSNGVKLIEIATAYGAFANGGFRVRPWAIERVENARGVTIYENKRPKVMKVISVDTAGDMTAMLRRVMTNGTGRAANLGKPCAGKTGTTDDYRDAWFVGYTPDIVTGVWVGNDKNTKMAGITGGTAPAAMWRDYMKVATIPYADSDFDYPQVTFSVPASVKSAEEENAENETSEEENAATIEEEAATGVISHPSIDSSEPTKEPITINVSQPQTSSKNTPFKTSETSAPPKPKPEAPTPKLKAPIPISQPE